MIRRPQRSTLFPHTPLFGSIAREVIAMRKAEPLDPADDPATGLLRTGDRKRTRLKARHTAISRMPSFFLNDPATTEIYPLSPHAALRIYRAGGDRDAQGGPARPRRRPGDRPAADGRSEEDTSESPTHCYISHAVFFFK